MKTRRIIIVGIVLIGAALIAGCATTAQGQPGAQDSALMDTEWVLVSLHGNSLVADTAITLRFDDASIEGSGGCNTYGGSYTASGDSLSLGDIYRTEMACPEPEGVFKQEQAYFQALDTVTHYHMDGERLELRDANGDQVLVFVTPTADVPVEQPLPAETTPELALDCTLEMDETHMAGEPAPLVFELDNPTARPLYVLTWYTPLEGIAGEILSVTRDGEAVLYQGALAKRGDPARDAYVVIEPGGTVSEVVDLREGYDLSTPGAYQVQFTAGLHDVTGDASLLPRKRDAHQPQPLTCNAVEFSVVAAPETPTLPLSAAALPEPPAGFRCYSHGPSSVSLWVPENWTVIEPGPHGGSTILQSYPQDKYVGGEPRQPGDAKCDLTVHPSGVRMAEVIQQLRSGFHTTIVSEREIILNSGRSGIRFEIESMGRSLSLVTTLQTAKDYERTIVLTCFGETAPFDEIAVTLGTR